MSLQSLRKIRRKMPRNVNYHTLMLLWLCFLLFAALFLLLFAIIYCPALLLLFLMVFYRFMQHSLGKDERFRPPRVSRLIYIYLRVNPSTSLSLDQKPFCTPFSSFSSARKAHIIYLANKLHTKIIKRAT